MFRSLVSSVVEEDGLMDEKHDLINLENNFSSTETTHNPSPEQCILYKWLFVIFYKIVSMPP